MAAAATQAHSVVAPTATARRVSAALVIVYALITMIPLVWIVLTSFKTPPEFDRLSAEGLLHPIDRGLLQPLHHPHPADAGVHRRAAARGRASATGSCARATW